ncbi:protein obstructor-E-like isoform X1 [Schistocerca nitens]|uniref:protein obstructor-E-like isoform X1 n=1 Tax=Schistocerca nitens TaxID=7011 RepID=UPI002119B596|nr:protein obstructor-E-like isoform X1 [Schistocerca nitens]
MLYAALICLAFCAQASVGQFRTSSSSQGGLSCPERNGRYPKSGQCDAYIQCEDGVPSEQLCPDGLLFNAKASIFSYPCQYPPEVDCEGRSQTQPAQANERCPRQFGYYKMGDSSHCGQFMNCVGGRGFVFDCPEGLAFNPELLRCEWPDQVKDCDAEAFLGFRCPEEAIGSEDIRFYRSPEDCQRFFVCVNGKPRLQRCADGYAFSDEFGECVGVENVTACKNQANLRLKPVRPSKLGVQKPSVQKQTAQNPNQYRFG